MSAKKTLIKNSSINLVGYIYLLFASFFSISILLNNLGREVFGVYVFLAAIIPLASVFDLGLGNAVVRRLSLPETSPEEKKQIWQTSFFLYLLFGLLISLTVLIIFTFFTNQLAILQKIPAASLSISVVILSLIVLINHLNACFLNLAQARQRFDIFNLKTLLVGSANTIFSAILSNFTTNLSNLFLLQLIFHFLTLIFLFRYALNSLKLKEILPQFNRHTTKNLINFGIRDFVGTLSSQFEAQFGKYALGTMISASAVAAYSIPQTIVLKAAGAISQIAIAFYPFGSSLLNKEKIYKLKRFIFAIEALTLIGGLLAIFITFSFGEDFLLWWLKDPVIVSLSYPILKIMVFYFCLVALTPIPTAVVQSLNYPQVSSFFALLTTSVEILLILYLVPQYSIMGVAYATLIAASISVPPFLITAAILLRRKTKQLEQ